MSDPDVRMTSPTSGFNFQAASPMSGLDIPVDPSLQGGSFDKTNAESQDDRAKDEHICTARTTKKYHPCINGM